MESGIRIVGCTILIAFLTSVCASAPSLSSPQVELKHIPDGGIQPQVAVDQNGTVHLVYFKGDPSQGDLFYARSKDGERFSAPIRVNSVPGTAVAIGNIRGARIAIGKRGNVFVVWNASPKLGNPALRYMLGATSAAGLHEPGGRNPAHELSASRQSPLSGLNWRLCTPCTRQTLSSRLVRFLVNPLSFFGLLTVHTRWAPRSSKSALLQTPLAAPATRHELGAQFLLTFATRAKIKRDGIAPESAIPLPFSNRA